MIYLFIAHHKNIIMIIIPIIIITTLGIIFVIISIVHRCKNRRRSTDIENINMGTLPSISSEGSVIEFSRFKNDWFSFFLILDSLGPIIFIILSLSVWIWNLIFERVQEVLIAIHDKIIDWIWIQQRRRRYPLRILHRPRCLHYN